MSEQTTGASRLRRQLGSELRGARTLAGLSQRHVADQVGISQATVVRVESGRGALLSRDRTHEWLTACSAPEELRERILVLVAAAHTETRGWEDGSGATGHAQGVARDREQGARSVRSYSPSIVPGLLQTAEYARQLLPQVDPTGTMDVAAALVDRLERQQVLYTGRRFDFILEEQAVRWSPGPGVRPAQLDRLLSVATLATVRVAVLPAAREGSPGWPGFNLYEPAAEEELAYVTTELLHGGQIVHDPDAVQSYEALWSRLWDAAATDEAAMELIRGS